MPRLACFATVVLLALATSAAGAHAGALGLIIAGEPAKQPVIETTLEPWLAARGYKVELRVSDSKVADKLVDCFIITDQRCGEAAVAKLNLPSTLFVMVEVHHDTQANTDEVKLTGWLYGPKGLSIASQSVFCRACKNDTLGPTVEDLAQALFAVQGEGTGRVRIDSKPSGATVRVDGTMVGATPWEQGLRTGPHTITIELPGHETHTEQVEIKKDETAAVTTTLVSLTRPPVRPRKKWPLGVVAAGVVMAAAGGVLIAMDEEPDMTSIDYRNSAPGDYVLAGAGVVTIGVGAFLYLRSGNRAPASPTAWIDPGRGGGIGMIGRF